MIRRSFPERDLTWENAARINRSFTQHKHVAAWPRLTGSPGHVIMNVSISDLEKQSTCRSYISRHAASVALSLESSPYQPLTTIITCFTSSSTTESIDQRSRLSSLQKPTSVGAVTQNSSTPEILALSPQRCSRASL